MTTNADLQSLYDRWHKQGPSSWFSDGQNERKAILRMGEPWGGIDTLEIGCGEGDLAYAAAGLGARVLGTDYSREAITKAVKKQPSFGPGSCLFSVADFHGWKGFGRVVLQGTLEHFDEPWRELDYIIREIVHPGGDIITSSPCFLNPRGLIWMTLATLFDAPMSLTDLHFLHPWEFEKFAAEHPLVKSIDISYTDDSWGNGEEMIADLWQRLPKVFPDMQTKKIADFVCWLDKAKEYFKHPFGATAVYRLQLEG